MTDQEKVQELINYYMLRQGASYQEAYDHAMSVLAGEDDE